MACFDDCCQAEGPEPSVARISTTAPEVALEVDEPEASVNGLEAMTPRAPTEPEPQPAEPTEPTKPTSFKESLAQTDFEILRGISLRESLRWGGNLWRTDPQYLETKAREALYRRSRSVKHLDAFLSHSWASKGFSKVLSLLMQSGCNYALLFWFIGVVLAAVLCYGDVLPMSFTYSPNTAKFNEDCPLGFWVMIFGLVGTLFGLVLSPYLPSCMHDACFMDAACIHQADEALTQRGIRGVGGFLAASKELRILWSPVYLSRLWCVFEVATYKKINPNGKVVLTPIFLETVAILFYANVLVGSIAYWVIRGAGYIQYGGYSIVPGCLIVILPLLITVHVLRRNYVRKHNLFSDFGNLDLDSVQCFSDADRDFLHSTIAQLYGSHEAFSSYVRGPLREELSGPTTRSLGPENYRLLLVTPLVSVFMDVTLALWKGNAPIDVLLIYLASMGILVPLFSASAFKLLVLLCDFLAEPLVRCSVIVDYYQTGVIFLVFMAYFALGFVVCLQPVLASRWESLPGIFVGCILILLLITWLQSKCDVHRMMSKTFKML